MFNIDGVTANFTWSCRSVNVLPYETSNYVELLNEIAAFKVRSPLLSRILLRDDTTNYLYRWEFSDARLWKQKLFIIENAPATMTFDVTDVFTVEEFFGNRTVREVLISLASEFKIDRFECLWS